MKNTKRLIAIALAAVMMFALCACGASGKSGNELKALTIYTDGTPGSSADMIMRTLGDIINKQTGITVSYENVTGGGGSNCKTAMMSNRKATSICMDTCSLALEIAAGTAPYDLTKLQPVTTIAQEYIAIVTSPDSPFDTFEDLVNFARENPGEVNWGASSAKGSQQLFEQFIVDELGLDINYIAYDSAANAKVAVIAGDTQICTASAGNLVSDIAAGVYKCLAVSAPERYEDIPEVPTLKECGVTGNANENSVWRGFFCSAEYDDALVQQIATLIENAKATDDWAQFLVNNHISAWNLKHAEFVPYVNDYLANCGEAVARMG